MAKQKAEQPKTTESDTIAFWLNEIAAARKREKDWRKDGQRIIDIYDGTKSETTPFNILFSNTETVVPALYSAIPRPVVTRRFKDDDPLGRHAATASQRMLEFLLDTNIDGYETFNETMKAGTLDAALPGRGVTGIKYDAETAMEPPPDGSPPEAEGTPYKKSELVCTESKLWNRVLFGYARKWSKMPWIAYEEHLDEEECVRLFGKEKAALITYSAGEEDDEDSATDRTDDEIDKGERKTALVYQIWDKDGGRKIRYVSPQAKDGFLLVQPDTLDLTGFFNCPRPLTFIEKSSDLRPVAPYTLYENQAKELNRLTIRISRVVEAIKARGGYDSSLGEDLKKVLEGDDNELLPMDSSSSLAAEKGFANAIWMLPLDTLVNVLDKLLVAREQCKQVIYEIMGIADIMRGASKASETLGAQQIKNQWGTLRIKPKQAEVQRYARDLLRLMLEVAASKFSEDTWAKMTGLPFTTEQQRAQLEAIAQAAQMSGQQLDPQTQQALQQPTWRAVLDMLGSDMQRAYRIDIETNSTIEPEAAEDQKNIAEMMNALGQFINGVGPLVEKGVMPFGVAKNMMLAISRRFRFGTEIEDELKAMQAPPPQDDGKAAEAAKLQAEQQAQQAEMQMTQQIEGAKLQAEQQKQQMSLQLERAKLQAQQVIETAKIQAERERDAAKIEAERQARLAELQAERATSQMEARMKQETELKKAELQVRGQVAVAKIGAFAKAAGSAGEGAEGESAQPRDADLDNLLKTFTAPDDNAALMRSELLNAIAAQGAQTQAMVMEILKAIRAPRVRIPVRGKDGRIERVIDESQEQGAASKLN